MNTFAKFLIVAAAAAALLPAAAQSVLTVSDKTIKEPATIVPRSAETDTKAMLEGWYLKNYAVLDYDADSKDSGDLSDEVLLQRLQALPTVIEMPLNSVVKNTIRYYAGRKQLVENMLGLSLYYMPIFEEALERNGMPLELRYLPVIESALVPTAVSRAGAAGLWQFMPATASGLDLEVNSLVDQRRDPYLASEAAAKYLKQLYEMFDDWSLAIAAYNCGPGNVNKALRRLEEGKHDFWEIYPFLPSETRGYVPAFIAANYIMNYHKEHNISPALARRPLVVDSVHVNRRVHFQQISDVMGIPMEEIRALNPQFRKDVIPGDIRPYSLVLPSLQVYAYIANEDSIVNHDAGKYARRGIVEPSSGAVTGRDAKGEYYEEEVVQYHKVRKGETFTKIAKRYGITVATLRKYNKLGKRAVAGKNLKIVTTRRRYKPAPAEEPEVTPIDSSQIVAPVTVDEAKAEGLLKDAAEAAGETPADTTAVGTVTNAFAPEAAPAHEDVDADGEPEPQAGQPKAEKKAAKKNDKAAEKPKKTAAATTPSIHKVRRGDNLSKIAKRYGVSVEALRKANNMAGDRLDVGQKLKIPKK